MLFKGLNLRVCARACVSMVHACVSVYFVVKFLLCVFYVVPVIFLLCLAMVVVVFGCLL